MSKIKTEKVNHSNAEELQKISSQTFTETYSSKNTAADMAKYLTENFSKEEIVKQLDNTESAFYFVRMEEEIIGYLKLNFGQAQTAINNQNGVEIERIYVLKQFHGKKIGQILCDKALQIAKDRKANYVWLGVWEENPRAIRFYKKNGFVEFDRHIFVLGNDQQMDIMMKLKL